MNSITNLNTISHETALTDVSPTCLNCQNCSIKDYCLTPESVGGQLSELKHSVKKRRIIHKGHLLFLAGQPRRNAYVIRKGSIKCYDLDPSGKERVGDFHLTGEVIGLEDLDTSTHHCFAVALEDSEICEIPLLPLQNLLLSRAALCRELLSLTTCRVRQQRHLTKLVSQSEATARVANFILGMAQRLRLRCPDQSRFRLSMARNDIASYLGIQMETVSRSIGNLQKQGLINVRSKQIELCKPEQLALKYAFH